MLDNLLDLSRRGCDLPGETDLTRHGDEPLNMEGSLRTLLAEGLPMQEDGWGTHLA